VTAVLATKLFEPRLPRALLPRSRLVKRFNDGLSARLTVVSAPAGYGKSTLLSEWRASPEGAATRLAWLSVDEADNDPVRFWSHVAAALHHADSQIGANGSDFQQHPLEAELAELLNELAALTDPVVLVLDDLHVVSSPDVLQPLSFFVSHLPPHVHLVIAGRVDPPLPLAALRARGDLSEVRMTDLQFTGDELDAYFDGLGIVLDAETLLILRARTEGWAAGLHLAALTLADVDDRAAFVRRFAGDDRTVVDYFVDEVIARQPVDVQDFLLTTSLLERMCGPLCDAVTGGSDGQAMLRAVENANLFLVALDNTRTWFRYHHLFAELLRRELRARGTAVETELRERAARWLAGQGLIDEAVPQAVAAGAWDLAMELGITHGLEMVVEGKSTTFRQLYGSSGEPRGTSPEARLGSAWLAALGGDLDGAREWLDAFDAAGGAMDGGPPGTEIDAEILRALLADRRGDIPECLARADRVLDLLEEHPDVRGIDREARRARAFLFRSRAAVLRDDLRAADHLLAETFKIMEEHAPARGVIEARGMRSLLALWDGRTENALRDADDALDLESQRSLDGTPHGAWAHLTLGIIHTERLQLDEAERHLSRALDVLRSHGDVNGVGLATAAAADRARLAGRAEDAVAIVAAVRDELVDGPAFAPLVARRLARAETKARVALGDAAPDAAVGATGPGRRREQIEALATAALAAVEADDPRLGGERLAEALRLASAPGWVAPFVELGAPLRPLLARLPPDPNPAVTRLRKQLLDALGAHRALTALPDAPVEQLSERELAVLRRLPSKLSNQEIAGVLYVSLNTVKTQIQSIYRKLGVNSRHEAIERARQLDLL
jgi:LuxR family transcriptional regulator, maltose regulon positive regulatory protein